jgi:CBS domain-containing protein
VFYALVVVVPASLESVQFVLAYLAVINVVLAAFNMLPGFPMDGGRVLRAILARNRPFAVATAQAAQVGKGFTILLGLFGVLAFNFILIAIAFFIYITATAEARQTALQSAVKGIATEDVMTPVDTLDTVTPGITVDELLDRMLNQQHTGYPVVEDGSVVGVVTLEDVRTVAPSKRDSISVGEVMTSHLETLSPDGDVIEALTSFQRNDIGRLVVLDEHDELAGIVTRTDVVTALSIGFVRSARSTLAFQNPKNSRVSQRHRSIELVGDLLYTEISSETYYDRSVAETVSRPSSIGKSCNARERTSG